MDSSIIAFLAIFVGALCAVVVPHILKKMDNPEGPKFNISYVYGMILTVVAASFMLIPETVDTSFRGIMTMFLAGLGIEGVVNKANTIRIKGKAK